MINPMLNVFRVSGFAGVWRAILWRLKLADLRALSLRLLSGRSGVEIGGPSIVFSSNGPIPVYPVVRALDNCNFAATTIWQPQTVANAGAYEFAQGHTAGNQFICEASDLHAIPSSAYDFLICSHVIEHVANPLRALREWLRVIRPGGTLLIVVPHRDAAFDHRRPTTLFQHLLKDFEQRVGEDDLTHLPEILALHDLDRDPGVGTYTEFEARSQRNFKNRCLHHHVFDMPLVAAILGHAGCDILALDQIAPHHIIALARKHSRESSLVRH